MAAWPFSPAWRKPKPWTRAAGQRMGRGSGVHVFGRLHRGPGGEAGMPGRQGRMRRPPVGLGPAEIEVGERAADRHPADIEGAGRSAGASASSAASTAASFAAKPVEDALAGAARPSSPRQSSSKSMTPVPSACRRSDSIRAGPAAGNSRGVPPSPSRYSQMTTESNSVPPSSSTRVGILPSGLRRSTAGLRLGQRDHGGDALDPVGNPRLMRHHHHLAHEGGARGPVQPHHAAPPPPVVRIARMPWCSPA